MNSFDYTPENPSEELFELVGRLKAFSAFLNSQNNFIDKKLCADILGIELNNECPGSVDGTTGASNQ